LFSIFVVAYPIWTSAGRLTWSREFILPNLFPIFGLLAFGLLWLHVVGAAFEPWLKKYINFNNFIESTSTLILINMILHPLLVLYLADWNIGLILSSWYVRLGLVGLGLLLTYDVGRWLNNHDFFIKHWNKILFISTLGFLLIFIHSIKVGSDLQSGTLRVVWIFYGVTAFLATIWNYGIKRYVLRD
jgi:hypothetical protein